MTLAEAEEIFTYWAQNPPTHLLVQVIARALGWRPPTPTASRLTDLASSPPPGIAIATGGIGMPDPVFDAAALAARNRARATAIARANAVTVGE